MLVRDVDRKADMRLVLRLRERSDLFSETAGIEVKLPVFIFSRENTTWMSTYIPKNLKNQKIELITRKFGAVDKEEYYVIDSRINNVKDLEVIDRLMDVPSFIINRSDMSGGFLNIYARFHSNFLEEISRLLSEYTRDTENSRISILGPSPGLMKVTENMDREYPLSIVRYRVPLEKGDSVVSRIMDEPGILCEVSNNRNRNGMTTTILYCDHPIDGKFDGVETISREDGVYQMDVMNSFHNMVREAANRRHIMRSRYFIRPIGTNLELTVLLPTVSVQDYYSIVFDLARKTENNVVINYVIPFSREAWDFL